MGTSGHHVTPRPRAVVVARRGVAATHRDCAPGAGLACESLPATAPTLAPGRGSTRPAGGGSASGSPLGRTPAKLMGTDPDNMSVNM